MTKSTVSVHTFGDHNIVKQKKRQIGRKKKKREGGGRGRGRGEREGGRERGRRRRRGERREKGFIQQSVCYAQAMGMVTPR